MTAACPVGCSDDATACAVFKPSFGVDYVASEAAAEGDLAISAGSTIDTETGEVRDRNGAVVNVPRTVITQAGGTGIRVLYAGTLEIDDVTVTGNLPIAFVAVGKLSVMGKIEAGGKSNTPGPGGVTSGPTVGSAASVPGAGGSDSFSGGGGNGTAAPAPYGGKIYSMMNLAGGGAGGSVDVNAPDGGGGGGAIQLVSYEAITILGGINVGGGGGTAGAGGGAGGTIVLEAPQVSIDGILAANGGAGDACDSGQDPSKSPILMDGQYSGSASVPASCTVSQNPWFGGVGGTAGAAPTKGQGIHAAIPKSGGDGGAVGRVVIGTTDSTYVSTTQSIVSAIISVEDTVH